MDNIKFQFILASISITGFIVITILAFLAAKFGTEWAKAMMDTILPLIVGCWITNFTTVMNYFFGTSSSSVEKSNTISNVLNRIKTPTT